MRKLPLGVLVAASGISSAGVMMTLIAIPWYVLQSTGSGTKPASSPRPKCWDSWSPGCWAGRSWTGSTASTSACRVPPRSGVTGW